MHQINVSAIISTLSGEIKTKRDFDVFNAFFKCFL